MCRDSILFHTSVAKIISSSSFRFTLYAAFSVHTRIVASHRDRSLSHRSLHNSIPSRCTTTVQASRVITSSVCIKTGEDFCGSAQTVGQADTMATRSLRLQLLMGSVAILCAAFLRMPRGTSGSAAEKESLSSRMIDSSPTFALCGGGKIRSLTGSSETHGHLQKMPTANSTSERLLLLSALPPSRVFSRENAFRSDKSDGVFHRSTSSTNLTQTRTCSGFPPMAMERTEFVVGIRLPSGEAMVLRAI